MSLLYGYVRLDRRAVQPALLDNMGSALSEYKSDAHTILRHNTIGMGFLNQYVTDESPFDLLPIYDQQSGLYFVCDAIIDNRKALVDLLSLQAVKELSDSRIVFEAYKKWKQECTSYLLGDFAFIIYDQKSNQVQMFRDHMGKRLIYYKVENGIVFFASLIKPLIDPLKKNRVKLNEQYLVEYLSLKEIRHEITPGITIYSGINYVLPASRLTICENSVYSDTYWDPGKIRMDHRARTDYVDEFRQIFSEAVRCRLRSAGDAGIFLSGGLDSSAVACVAAGILREQNKVLNTYTAVPMASFVNKEPRRLIADESSSVLEMKKLYPNMNVHFIASEGINSLNVIEQMLQAYEQPYKFVQNSYWLYDIFRNAHHDGCKVLLNGFQGNATISYGSYKTVLFEHLLRCRFGSFLADSRALCFHNKLGRQKMLLRLSKDILKSVLCFDHGEFCSELVKDEYLARYNIKKKMRDFGLINRPIFRVEDERRLYFHSTVNNQISSMSRKLSVANNICERDPTSDKRVVEFCLSLPYDCFFDRTRGTDRGLIRQAMSGIVPSDILYNKYRGHQAVDWLERIGAQGDSFINAFKGELNNPGKIFEYLDMNIMSDIISKAEDDATEATWAAWNILVIHICDTFRKLLERRRMNMKEWQTPEIFCITVDKTEDNIIGGNPDGGWVDILNIPEGS